MAAITWTNILSSTTTLSGTTLSKTSGAEDTPNAGALSQALVGDGAIEITVPSATAELYLGLDPSASLVTDYTPLDYLFMVLPNGNISYREGGTYKGELGSVRAVNTVLKFSRASGVITFYVNGVLVYTSPVTTTANVSLHAVLLDVGNSVTAGTITSGGTVLATLPAPAQVTQTSAPTSYPTAITHRLAIPLPAVIPAAPAKGDTYLDVEFNQYNIRGTDGNTGTLPARLNRSHRLNSSSPTCVWSRDDQYLIGTTPSGAIELFSVNTSYDTALRGRLTWVRDLTFTNEPTFSRTAAGRIYGCVGLKLKEHVVATNTYTDLIDLAVVDPAYAGAGKVFGGSVQSSMSNPERIACFYGGNGADQHFRCLVFDRATPANQLILDTQAKTLNGVTVPGMEAFWIHSIAFLDGRYVQINSTQSAGVAIFYIWDTATGTIGKGTAALHCNGHSALTWHGCVNNESFGDSPYFAYQLVKRSLSDLTTYSKVFGAPSFSSQVYADSHYATENQRSDVQTPIAWVTYRYYENIPENLNLAGLRINTLPYGPMDSEFGFTHPDTGVISRFGHTFSNVYADDGTGASGFWYQPMMHASHSGRFIARSGNHMKTLGLDPTVGEPTTAYRSDIWILDTEWVPEAGGGAPPEQDDQAPIEVVVDMTAPALAPVIEVSVRPLDTQEVNLERGNTVANIDIYRGARKTINFTLQGSGDITGWTIGATVKAVDTSGKPTGAPVMALVGTVTSGSTRKFSITVTETDSTIQPGDYAWDVWRTTGVKYPLMPPSQLRILPSVTY
jgi:hypothetical protein